MDSVGSGYMEEATFKPSDGTHIILTTIHTRSKYWNNNIAL